MGTVLETNDIEGLRAALKLACSWLVEIAQVKTEGLTVEKNRGGHPTAYWKGAIRGEYSVAAKEWSFFCPMWHTGQAIKALVMASRVLNDDSLLGAARDSADFIAHNRVNDESDPDYGMLLAYEDFPDLVNTSAVLETIDGLFYLADATNDLTYSEWAVAAARWVLKTMYLPGEGLVMDWYHPAERRVVENNSLSKNYPGRPLADDAVLLKAARASSDPKLRDAFYEIIDRLIREEDPPGNWIAFGPCSRSAGSIHPRHAYWWGRPMVAAYRDSGQGCYLQTALRAGEWYAAAQRRDGGILRGTYVDFKTDSFGHATSGTACAVLMYHDLWKLTQDPKWIPLIKRGLRYCMKMQFVKPEDPNLKGAILEKVKMPNGTDQSPYYVRDLGSIFFIQAASDLLLEV